jgi:hypothetical protein
MDKFKKFGHCRAIGKGKRVDVQRNTIDNGWINQIVVEKLL